MNEDNKKPSPGNSKLSTIFLVVLGLHVVVIAMILAYNLLKGDTDTAEENYFGAVEQSAPYRPESPMSGRPAPQIETEPAEAEEPVSPEIRTADHPMSMPSTRDPIWAMGTMEPRHLEPTGENVRTATATSETSIETVMESPSVSLEEEVREATSSRTYTVAKGDSLSKIGSQFGVSVADLRRINNIDGSLIRVGQKLQIPAAGTSSPVVAVQTPKPAVSNPGAKHVVQKGDTLWKIARQYQVNPNDLAKLNGISDPTQLKIGTSLNIPGAQQMAQPAGRQQAPRVENADMAMRRE